MAEVQAAEKKFKPYIPDGQIVPEFTAKAIILGAIFGIIFGAATVYLALKAGLTVSASIPIAVLAIAVFKRIGKSTILENNIVQTIGSAGESVAAGVAFTIPALIFLASGDQFFTYFNIFTLALVGGILGVLFMVPLRRSLIVKEICRRSGLTCSGTPGYSWRKRTLAVASRIEGSMKSGLMLIETSPSLPSTPPPPRQSPALASLIQTAR